LFIITLRRLKERLLAVLIACLILLSICWGLPRAYDLLASEGEEEFEELDDPVRVDADFSPEMTAEWLKAFSE